mgnify:CR=1 FL=1
MRVLLVSANTLKVPYPVYPLGLDFVAASLAGRHEVHIADLNLGTGDRYWQETVTVFKPDVIGLSVRNIDTTRQVTCAMHPGTPGDGHEVPSSMMTVSPVVALCFFVFRHSTILFSCRSVSFLLPALAKPNRELYGVLIQ